MTDYREQAIRDVAVACGTSTKEVTEFVGLNDAIPNLTAYAVAQRECALELETALNGLLARHGDCSDERYWAEWDAARAALQAQLKPPEQTLYEEGRCQICGWPLAERIEDGCVPGSCGMRPREHSEEWFRYKERRDWLQTNHPEELQAQLQQKEGERG